MRKKYRHKISSKLKNGNNTDDECEDTAAKRRVLGLWLYNNKIIEGNGKLVNGSQLAKMKKSKNEKEYSWHVSAMKFIGRSSWSKKLQIYLNITIYVNMWNLGQFRENLIFCQ